MLQGRRSRLRLTLYRAPLLVVNFHCHPCNIDVLKSEAGLRIRLPAEQVFILLEIVLNVHRLVEIAISYTVHSQRVWILSAIMCVCASTIGGPCTNHALRRPWCPRSSDASTPSMELVWR